MFEADMKRLLGIIILTAVQLSFAESLVLESAWARATPPGARTGAVYLRVHNPGSEAVQIVNISASIAGSSEVHESREMGGISRMRKVDPFIIQPGETLQLKPGGKHIMLINLNKPLSEGQQFSLVLKDKRRNNHLTDVMVGGFGQMEMPR